MKSLRIRVMLLSSWLVVFIGIDKLLNSSANNSITVGFVFLMLCAGLMFPRMPRVLPGVIFAVVVIGLVVIKTWVGDLSNGWAISTTVVESCAIGITLNLSLWVSRALIEFEKVVSIITVGKRENMPESALTGQGLIYREVRRARNHHFPLALVSIRIDENSIVPAAEKIIQEIQRSMMKEYKLRELSNMLCAELEDCAVIVQETDHYLAVLPDITPDELPFVVERLRHKAFNQVGVEIKIGVATLPNDSYTFDGLVERAHLEMEKDREPQLNEVLEQIPLEHRITQ